MPSWKEGERVRIATRFVTDADRKGQGYYQHMGGLTGVVQNVYSDAEIAVKIEPNSMGDVAREVHKVATERMRERFLSSISEEQRKQLSPEEQAFDAHYVLLVRSADLEKA